MTLWYAALVLIKKELISKVKCIHYEINLIVLAVPKSKQNWRTLSHFVQKKGRILLQNGSEVVETRYCAKWIFMN